MKKQNWDFKKIALKNLVLWDNNPRTFDKNSLNPNQKDIISRYPADKLIRIAKNILKYQNANLQPGELTVIKKGTQHIVFDGNRRISAYKLLLSPSLATDKKDKFLELSKQVSFGENKKLRFNIAPDIKSALSRINDLHNDNFHENWNPTAKTNFALLNIDGQIKELKEKKIHLKRDSLYKKIRAFSYNQNIKNIIHNPNEFKITSLERIVDSSIGKEYLNYDFNEKGEIVVRDDEKKFDQILKKIAEDIALGNADSRKQHNNEQKEIYFKSVFKILGLNKEDASSPASSDKDIKGGQVGTTAKKDWITYDEYSKYRGADRVKDMLKELYKVVPAKGENINILSVSLRVVIELAVYDKLKNKKLITKIVKEEKELREKAGKELPKNWTPGLKEMLKFMLDEANLSVDPQDKKSIDKIMRDRKDFIESLDLFVHDVTYIPTETQIREIWKSFCRPIFEIISKI